MKGLEGLLTVVLALGLATSTSMPVWTQIPSESDLLSRDFSFRVALKQQNLDVLEKLLYLVSEPDSPHYGQHLTADNISSLVKLEDEAILEVETWLTQESNASCGLTTSLAGHSDYIKVDTCVERA